MTTASNSKRQVAGTPRSQLHAKVCPQDGLVSRKQDFRLRPELFPTPNMPLLPTTHDPLPVGSAQYLVSQASCIDSIPIAPAFVPRFSPIRF